MAKGNPYAGNAPHRSGRSCFRFTRVWTRDHNRHNHNLKPSNKKKIKMSSSSSSEKVRTSHILIKHQGSRRKASWKDPEGRVISTTTRDDVVSQLKNLRIDIVSGKASFFDVAYLDSHERGPGITIAITTTLSPITRKRPKCPHLHLKNLGLPINHILIKHQGSRHKASWKDPEGRVISATTRDDAVSQLKNLRVDIVSGETSFSDVAYLGILFRD
ncbi:Peptidyl-prolyl cis-trans isomerase [Forsythia ovata]|uniref:peptidylprolyl isomerase n=1 Tax=Forsythia ovata TaxID=205694 RepID=A0ABD1U9C0_9LAMI